MNAIKEEGVVMNAIKEDVNPTRAQLEAELARLQAEISGLEGKASAMVITPRRSVARSSRPRRTSC